MRARTALFSLLLIALAFSCGEHASAADSEDLARSVDAVFAEHAKPGSPGCSLAVVQNGRITYEKGYGLASIEHGVPIDPKKTVFDIGSTSKQITAACVLLLARDGKLSLDDEVRKHIPELPDYGTPVTIRHLLHHTSGIRDYIDLMAMGGINFEDWATAGDALAAIARQKKLDFKPGSEHSYSNSGYFLLSQIVERVSGKKMREFAQERIFGPLGMTNTQILDDHTKVIPHKAASYAPGPDGGFALVMSNWEQTGDGAVQTTVEDLAKWDQNFYDPKVGGPWLVEQLQTRGALNDGETIDYARGLMVGDYRGLRRVSHGGGWAGYRAEMIRFPDEKLSVVTLCNLGTANPSALAQQVADLYLADKLQPEAQPAAAANNAPAGKVENADRYAGVYWSSGGGLVRRIEVRDGKLFYVRGQGGPDSELAPLGGDRFRMVGIPAEVSFQGSATPRRMELIAGGGRPMVFEEVKPVTLKPENLIAYAGTYTSPELDTTWTLAVEGDQLKLRGQRGPAMPLEPTFADAFNSPTGLIRFQREGQKVTGFLVGAGRARDLKFEKKP
jgi:CubicO group peptidase (beta-lactamase class C family)